MQRDLLSKFHVSDPRQFNSGQDFWAVPDDPASTPSGTGAGKQPPYYLLTQFPGLETSAVPAHVGAHPDLAAEPLRAAHRRAHPRTGRSSSCSSYPATAESPGRGRRNRPWSTTNRSEVGSPCSAGRVQAQVVYGNLLSLPYGGGLLYVQPVYLRSTNVANPFPLMRLVLVSYGSTVGFSDTLGGAIQELVKKSGQTPPTGGATAAANTGQPPAGRRGERGAARGGGESRRGDHQGAAGADVG